ncbi:phage/plasmid replication protein, II/X family [Novosphingobium album (ex Liu et al. 2023)]|uniref:Phage/plasmid replication protein, II/X family n=1 Tax=Novosphingobium album (ex Liu et al. 2023) TaxID=3031130 RepID=A0ABT5WPD4_9SPHN|nr:phage/plasmid replication protein, II/X family [Novosphingobium album (ex Liu et al. 2023)]MDE8651888.1 phage/plasmid replication protein, II/X family [Novosphingobium album (ex Liu et al. 2023)]
MSAVMVDFLTVETPDPFGQVIHGGEVVKVDRDGEVEWSTRCKLSVKGSWDGQLVVRNLMADDVICPGFGTKRSGLELSGNPAKFLQGHNLFGVGDPTELIRRVVDRVGSVLFPGTSMLPVDLGMGQISRIDLTASWLLDRAEDVLPFLRAMEERVWCPYRGRGVQSEPGTLYYGYSAKGKRAKDWQLKLYSKGLEVARRRLPGPAMEVPGLLDEVNRTVRVELTLRTAELKRLGLRKLSDWTPEKAGDVWRSYVDRLNFGESAMTLDATDLAGILKPRLLDAVASWKAGNDMRAGRSKTSFYRLRQEVLEACGYDIASPVPKSNVVPLRRVIEAKPAQRPSWADQLTAALEQAA